MAEFPVTKTDEEWKRILTPEHVKAIKRDLECYVRRRKAELSASARETE